MWRLLRRGVDFLLDAMCAVAMTAVVLITLFQVGNRFVLHLPVPWSEEVARFLAVWVVLLGAARCVREASHIEIDLFYAMLGARAQWLLSIVINLLFLTLVVIIVDQSRTMLPIIARQTAPASQISMFWVYLAAPVSSGLIVFYLLENLWTLLRRWRRPQGEERGGVEIV